MKHLFIKPIAVSGLAVLSLALTSCTDDFQRGAKAFLSEFQNEEAPVAQFDQTISLPSAYAEPVSVTSSPGLAAYEGISSSHATSGLSGATSTYEQGFREGFTAGFDEGAKVKQTIASAIAENAKTNQLVSATAMSNPYSANQSVTTKAVVQQKSSQPKTATKSTSTYKKSYSSSNNWNSGNSWSSKSYNSRGRNCYGGS